MLLPQNATTLLDEAWTRLASLPGMTHEYPSDLPCHPTATALVVRDVSPIALQVCVQCLTAYVSTSDGSIYSQVAEALKRCGQCNQEAPTQDFMSRNGWETRFCSTCRANWGKAQRAAAVVEVEKEKEQAQVDLEHLRAGLQRLEQELLE